ncbi:MAG: ATP synthase F1 subunit gamma [Leptospiraceae bacterium]|nr:ATP synthase F1 subunit gamma [Leptospiraceae bacterium]MCB1319278.1 ATP synthase F1 subunit gamma [Leptospiraceae bacterium]
MAGSKIIKKRIASVRNTRKITRTMEMVSTAKSKKLVDRVNAAQPYTRKLHDIMATLVEAGAAHIDSPLMRRKENPERIALLVITANRGLCGGYNSNVLKLARVQLEILRSEGRKADVYAVGKKATSYFKFIDIPVEKAFLDIDDNFTYEQAEDLANFFMNEFVRDRYDRVDIISTVYHSAGRQTPEVNRLLPIGLKEMTGEADQHEGKLKAEVKTIQGPVIYDPSPEQIMLNMIPLAVKTSMYGALLEAAASEQIYRRVAMKNATDAAGEMLKNLTREYNRARQASITQELSEIVAGADAV